jgi:hypothetical protein
MKTTFIETWQDGVQLLGSDMTSICKDITTKKKLDNAIKSHVERLKQHTSIHPNLSRNYQLKYHSVYK